MSRPQLVRNNEWHKVVDAAAAVEVTSSVSVIIPCRDPGIGLVRLIDSLAAQELVADCEVIVVDDNSRTPIHFDDESGIPVRVVRLPSHDTFGAGMARNAGAQQAQSSTLVFLDADLLVGPRTIHDLVRWVEVVNYATVTGVLSFVPDEVLAQAYTDGPVDLEALAALGSDDQSWRNKHFDRSFDLTLDRSDLYHSTVGACIAVSRDHFETIGGFREVGVRGIEDTEFGHRLHNSGALMVLERDAVLIHQGKRSFDSARSQEIKRIREPYMLDLLPGRKFGRARPDAAQRQVPTVLIDCGGFDAQSPAVQSLLAEPTQDVTFIGIDGADPSSLGPEGLADLDAMAVPYRLEVLDPGEPFPDGLIEVLIRRMETEPLGALHLIGAGGQTVASWRWVRAANRARLVGAEDDVGLVFLEAWTRLDALVGN